MADAVVHIGENSPEHVALKLYERVNAVENQANNTRERILDLYAECLLAVREPLDRLRDKSKSPSPRR